MNWFIYVISILRFLLYAVSYYRYFTGITIILVISNLTTLPVYHCWPLPGTKKIYFDALSRIRTHLRRKHFLISWGLTAYGMKLRFKHLSLWFLIVYLRFISDGWFLLVWSIHTIPLNIRRHWSIWSHQLLIVWWSYTYPLWFLYTFYLLLNRNLIHYTWIRYPIFIWYFLVLRNPWAIMVNWLLLLNSLFLYFRILFFFWFLLKRLVLLLGRDFGLFLHDRIHRMIGRILMLTWLLLLNWWSLMLFTPNTAHCSPAI